MPLFAKKHALHSLYNRGCEVIYLNTLVTKNSKVNCDCTDHLLSDSGPACGTRCNTDLGWWDARVGAGLDSVGFVSSSTCFSPLNKFSHNKIIIIKLILTDNLITSKP